MPNTTRISQLSGLENLYKTEGYKDSIGNNKLRK